MESFTVPQFIEVEDKIFGPITTRQFIILLIAGLICFIAYKTADQALFTFLLALIGGGALVLAFVKINGQDFHFFLLNIFQTLRRPSLRVWQREYSKDELLEFIKESKIEKVEEEVKRQLIPASRMRDLALLVNTGGYYRGE
jgi:hypothetical protein